MRVAFPFEERYLKIELMYATRVVGAVFTLSPWSFFVVGVAAACAQGPLYVMCASVSNQKTATGMMRVTVTAAAAVAAHYPEVIVYQMKVDHFLSLFHFFYFLSIRFMLFVFFSFIRSPLCARVSVCVCGFG